MGDSHECNTRSPLINQGYPPISQEKPRPKGKLARTIRTTEQLELGWVLVNVGQSAPQHITYFQSGQYLSSACYFWTYIRTLFTAYPDQMYLAFSLSLILYLLCFSPLFLAFSCFFDQISNSDVH